MPSIGTTSKPAYVYDAGTDTWVPIGPGEHTHDYIGKDVITTTGDIIYASAANTPARLGIGSSGQVLSVSGGIPTWTTPAVSGGMTLLDTLTFSGSSVTSSTFSSSYPQLMIYIKDAYCGTNQQLNMRLNGDTANNYTWTFVNDGNLAAESTASSFLRVGNIGTLSGKTQTAYQKIEIMRPSDTDSVFVSTTAQYIFGSTVQNFDCTGVYDNSAAITSVTFYISTGSFTQGTAYIYGVK